MMVLKDRWTLRMMYFSVANFDENLQGWPRVWTRDACQIERIAGVDGSAA
jgi:hypothetical protein